MDSSELALKMLEWEKKRGELDVIEEDIERAVLELGKTQTVGNVRASYSAGRKSYDYQAAFLKAWNFALEIHDDPTVNMFAEAQAHSVKQTIDYKFACEQALVKDIPFVQSAPTVSVKLLKE